MLISLCVCILDLWTVVSAIGLSILQTRCLVLFMYRIYIVAVCVLSNIFYEFLLTQ